MFLMDYILVDASNSSCWCLVIDSVQYMERGSEGLSARTDKESVEEDPRLLF